MWKATNQRSAASAQVRLYEVLAHFTRLAFGWAACVSLDPPAGSTDPDLMGCSCGFREAF
jgi:hypothetical protein